MIILYHKDNRLLSVFDNQSKQEIKVLSKYLVEVFFDLAQQYHNTLIVWCHQDLKAHINQSEFGSIFRNELIMASFNTKESYYIDFRIGYIEFSPFINVNKNVSYPTWLMSSCVGGINSNVISRYNKNDYKNESFEFVLNSIAKRGISKGLFCYSEPKLLCFKNEFILKDIKSSKYELFKFIKMHYKTRWLIIMLFNCLIYEKRFLFLNFLRALFVSKPKGEINLNVLKDVISDFSSKTIDVIIPTMGRKDYLLDVLKDLSNQTVLPKNVIIVEQNPDLGSVSNLEYLHNQIWPFNIKHTFINKIGACNARNIALSQIESDWVFLADDDIRFSEDIFEIAFQEIENYGLHAATLSCLRKGDVPEEIKTKQWITFGSGCSIISKVIVSKVKFDLNFEHGFGEDADFGMQIRNIGEDIGYINRCTLLHLKAPIGGFRTKFNHSWETDKIQPKPSPTVMLFNLKHQSGYQVNGYKSLLFLSFFSSLSIKNPILYLFQMKKRWNKSVYIANQLKNRL